MRKAALILIQVLTVFVLTGTANRIIRDIEDEIKDAFEVTLIFEVADKETQGFVQKLYGASCIKDSQCLVYVAYCDNKASLSAVLGLGVLSVDGKCRPVIWVFIVLTVLGFLGTWISCCLYDLLKSKK